MLHLSFTGAPGSARYRKTHREITSLVNTQLGTDLAPAGAVADRVSWSGIEADCVSFARMLRERGLDVRVVPRVAARRMPKAHQAALEARPYRVSLHPSVVATLA